MKQVDIYREPEDVHNGATIFASSAAMDIDRVYFLSCTFVKRIRGENSTVLDTVQYSTCIVAYAQAMA